MAFLAEPAFVHREQPGDMRARAMADEDDVPRIAAPRADIRLGPAHRGRRILDEIGKGVVGRQPVVCDDGYEAPGRKGAPGKFISGLVATAPSAAMQEDDNRQRGIGGNAPRRIDIELLPVALAIGDIARHLFGSRILGHDPVEQRQPVGGERHDRARRDDEQDESEKDAQHDWRLASSGGIVDIVSRSARPSPAAR
jgi:hypothetical protein